MPDYASFPNAGTLQGDEKFLVRRNNGDDATTTPSDIKTYVGSSGGGAEFQLKAEKDQPGGYAGLDSNGDVAESAIPDTISRTDHSHSGYDPVGTGASEAAAAVSNHEDETAPHTTYRVTCKLNDNGTDYVAFDGSPVPTGVPREFIGALDPADAPSVTPIDLDIWDEFSI